MASYPSSQSYGGLGNYAGSSQQDSSSAQKSAQIQIGLSSYGQSLSSEQLDLNNLGSLPSYHQYSGQYSSSQAPPAPYGNQCGYPPQIDLNDPQLLQQVDQIVSSLIENKRPMLRRQVITVPASTPGRVACITRRLPTPPPDIIERITVVKPPRDVINLCIEKPYQPGPCYQERNICGKPRKPVIQPRVVQVPPRSAPQSQPQQGQCQPCPPSAQIQIFAGPQSAAFSGVASAPQQPTQTLQQQQPTQSYALPASSGVPQAPFSGYSAAPAQPNYNLPQQAPQLPPPQASAAYASAAYQQYQQGPQFSAQFAQQPQYGQQPIYQTPDALQQTQSQTGFNPQQPVYANNFPGGFPPQQQGYPQQAY
jgi:hypothetical protein